jgi:hypothetical protein
VKDYNFNVILNEALVEDIQNAVDYYSNTNENLGKRFYKLVKGELKSLKKDALLYQIRYKNIRCLAVEKFSYLIHFNVNQKTNTVFVFALICTYKNPNDHWIK